jgi:hypothetical protein
MALMVIVVTGLFLVDGHDEIHQGEDDGGSDAASIARSRRMLKKMTTKTYKRWKPSHSLSQTINPPPSP